MITVVKFWISFHYPLLLPIISTLITKTHNQMKLITRIHLMLLILKRARLPSCHLWLACSMLKGYCRFSMILIVLTNNHIMFVWFIWGSKSCQETKFIVLFSSQQIPNKDFFLVEFHVTILFRFWIKFVVSTPQIGTIQKNFT